MSADTDDRPWWVYIVRCRFGTFYTGITTELDRRLAQHADGRGAKYLRGRGPLQLVYRQQVADRATALVLERRIKSLDRARKQRLIQGQLDEVFYGLQARS